MRHLVSILKMEVIMDKNTKISIVIGLSLAAIAAAYSVWQENKGTDVLTGLTNTVKEEKILPNVWEPLKQVNISDTGKVVIKVTWDQKYGQTKVEYCRAVFHNAKEGQYMLTAPWLGSVRIERSNTNDISFDFVEFSDSIRSQIKKF